MQTINIMHVTLQVLSKSAARGALCHGIESCHLVLLIVPKFVLQCTTTWVRHFRIYIYIATCKAGLQLVPGKCTLVDSILWDTWVCAAVVSFDLHPVKGVTYAVMSAEWLSQPLVEGKLFIETIHQRVADALHVEHVLCKQVMLPISQKIALCQKPCNKVFKLILAC